MGADSRSKLEFKLQREADKTVKDILTILEADMLGSIRDTDNAQSIEREFRFLRKRILDYMNDYKRMMSAVLKRFIIEEERTTINVVERQQ
jgi:hypothetical protein